MSHTYTLKTDTGAVVEYDHIEVTITEPAPPAPSQVKTIMQVKNEIAKLDANLVAMQARKVECEAELAAMEAEAAAVINALNKPA